MADRYAARYTFAMSTSFDVIVAGVGAMGSLTVCELASRGQRVLGLDKFAPPHVMGSSHGHSRIIREAYFEDPRYVPLVQHAYKKWAELEATTDRILFRRTGGLMLGPPDGMLVRGALRSAELHALPYELLNASQVRARFPAFHPSDDMVGVVEPNAGILSPERCIETAIQLARARGAELRTNEPLVRYAMDGETVVVTTARGSYRARSLVLSVGAWMNDLVPEMHLPLRVQRQVQYWFRPTRAPAQFTPDHFPIFISEYAPDMTWYGFPDVGDGLKLALHHFGAYGHPDTIDRTVGTNESDAIREVMRRYIPDADGPPTQSAACMYTITPDEHFVIGGHPSHPAVIVASPCSGHGFKFASAIGEVLADLAMERQPAFDLALFSPTRFAV
jgi:sarcosine oxidase